MPPCLAKALTGVFIALRSNRLSEHITVSPSNWQPKLEFCYLGSMLIWLQVNIMEEAIE